jgi:hypothetical protein
MELKTASSVVNCIVSLEADCASLYSQCAARFADLKPLFEKLAKGNAKFAKRIKKVYYSSVTDALETNFSFEGLEADIVIPGKPPASAQEALAMLLGVENKIQAFYSNAAEQSQVLLADVPKAMQRVAMERKKRIAELEKRAA